jgi:hypothetical protein
VVAVRDDDADQFPPLVGLDGGIIPTMTRAVGAADQLQPVTERILGRLPGPHALWIVLWALLAWLNAGLNLLLEPEARSAVWEQSRLLVILNYAALSVAIVITLWGTARIARRLEARASTSKMLDVRGTRAVPRNEQCRRAVCGRGRHRDRLRAQRADRGRLDPRCPERGDVVFHRDPDLDVSLGVRRPPPRP